VSNGKQGKPWQVLYLLLVLYSGKCVAKCFGRCKGTSVHFLTYPLLSYYPPHLPLSICLGMPVSPDTRPFTIVTVRGHPSVSLLPLSLPTLPLFICIPPHHLCTSSKDHTSSRRPLGPMVRWLSRSHSTDGCRHPTPLSTLTSEALDKLWMHWDRCAWHYSTPPSCGLPFMGGLVLGGSVL
jgi:hypothetical protein